MRTTARTILAVASSALLLTACSSSGGSSIANVVTPPNSPAPIVSSPPASNPGTPPASDGTGVTPAADPCQVVTSAEASALSGVTYGAGKESVDNHTKGCTYEVAGHSLSVQVAQAPDPATAQAYWDSAQAKAKANLKAEQQKAPAGVTWSFTDSPVSGLGDRATTIAASASLMGHSFGITGIYVIQGATFMGIEDLAITAGSPASTSALVAQAQTSVGRL